MDAPEDLRYAENHEWVRAKDDAVIVGITDFAQDALGDIVFVDLPEVGRKLAVGESFGEVESTKSVSDVYAPVGGVVTEINTGLEASPEVVNSDPYGEGWFLVMQPADLSQMENLMDVAAYRAFTE